MAYCNFFCLLFTIVCIHLSTKTCSSKIIEGTFASSENWAFLGKFCFAESQNQWSFELRYPYNYCPKEDGTVKSCQALVLYYDTKEQWDSVYKSNLNCKRKIGEKLANGTGYLSRYQLLYLDPSRTYSLQEGNFGISEWCYRVSSSETIYCKNSRSVFTQRPRWWFFVVANCDSDNQGTFLMEYKISFTNGDSYQKHFSFDERYIFEMDIVAVIVFTIMLVYAITCACILYQKKLLHVTYQIYVASLSVKLLSWVVLTGAYWSYQQGYEQISIKRLGFAFSFIAYFILLIMVVLLAKGYNVTRSMLPSKSKFTLVGFLVVYAIAYATASLW